MNKKEVLAWLEKKGTKKTREAMPRYGIVAKRAFGVPMGTLLRLGKQLGTDHALTNELWVSGWYEGRLLAPLISEAPAALWWAEKRSANWRAESDQNSSENTGHFGIITPKYGLLSTRQNLVGEARHRGRKPHIHSTLRNAASARSHICSESVCSHLPQ